MSTSAEKYASIETEKLVGSAGLSSAAPVLGGCVLWERFSWREVAWAFTDVSSWTWHTLTFSTVLPM